LKLHRTGCPTPDKLAAKNSYLSFDALRSDKAKWVRAAKAAGKELTEWVAEKLNNAAKLT